MSLSTELAFRIFNEKLPKTIARVGGEISLEDIFYEFLIKLKALRSFKALFCFNVTANIFGIYFHGNSSPVSTLNDPCLRLHETSPQNKLLHMSTAFIGKLPSSLVRRRRLRRGMIRVDEIFQLL